MKTSSRATLIIPIKEIALDSVILFLAGEKILGKYTRIYFLCEIANKVAPCINFGEM